ncbi:carboxypeptidase regulatory-like domain-containing protein [Methylicorpusculum sp.]|uniref:carboxypeptidase regulatory-like domain-containing protein n=1 Tax=Methylicorpusculum sp. TaxID=2713644 RepID=UPI00272F63D5|nr:carboxypeptidase regulatory-like domain-containing protein [Methylicorpusculum sp.]MDP2179417.1 carboxypeptidase regulatory-like domain-containing protein [Methylicorpusculum sp.]MDP3529625.1 carboxypeptidase regulatory-like domain-containing protein [Methylicorpusculum sp.]MDZ4152433.1 carboxypeptidase regulatory-like domain-containing protein [Methylicorpusculum sp.]
MKPLNYALIIPCLLFSLSAFAEESSLKPETQGDVTFVSGGIGETEREALQSIKADYNLNLLFAYKGSGQFMSDVNVRIADSKGNVLVETFAEGPYLFANLKPGNYLISAVKDGNEIRQKAKIGGSKTTSLSFYWPLQAGSSGNP